MQALFFWNIRYTFQLRHTSQPGAGTMNYRWRRKFINFVTENLWIFLASLCLGLAVLFLLVYWSPRAGVKTSAIPMEAATNNNGPTNLTSVPVAQATAYSQTISPTANNASFILSTEELEKYMLQLINADRLAAGLKLVEWDQLAAQVGRAHAHEMAENQYMSHWNLAGVGPDIRYSFAGGTEWDQENVFSSWQRYDNGTPVPVTDWKKQVEDAQQALMNSPGHRANILNPDHTHVGVGLAYNPNTSEFRVAQEFINRYITINDLPVQVKPGSDIRIKYRLLNGTTDPLVNLAYEPFPQPLSMEQLNATSTYSSPAQFVASFETTSLANGDCSADIEIGDAPGLYHIRIWVTNSSDSPQAVDWVIRVN